MLALMLAAALAGPPAPAPRAVQASETGRTTDRVLIYGGAALDVATTEWALASCATCYEGNAIMRNRGTRIAAKAAVAVALDLGTKWMRRRGHPRAARVLSVAAGVTWGGAAAYNATLATGGK